MFRRALCIALPLVLATGCVSKKKYRNLESDYANLEGDYTDLQGRYSMMERDMQRLNDRLAQLEQMDPSSATYYRDLLTKLRPMMQNGDIEVTLRGNRMVIGLADEIFFDFASEQVTPAGQQLVDELASIISQNQDFTFQVEGHTDAVPVLANAPWDSNWDLGAERAINVVERLTESGIPAQRLSAATYGATDPVVETSGAEMLNRRVNITIVPDLAQIDGSNQLVQAARAENALVTYPSFDMSRLTDAQVAEVPSSSTTVVGVWEQPSTDPRDSYVGPGPEVTQVYTFQVKNGKVISVSFDKDMLTFLHGDHKLEIMVDRDEIDDEMAELLDEIDDPNDEEAVTGREVDDEIAELLDEALDKDTLVRVNGVLVPGHEIDDEIAEYFDEVLDGPAHTRVTQREIQDELNEIEDEIDEHRTAGAEEDEEY